ncbi:MAG: hypothetical protein UY72_C0021G0002 [Candidatus Uhrbacteria bacterium GW2011_GWD2_52_7]|uniref:Uncharacterized protein n=1 Tax=Candidatus Uhrbacteria bacterium GW2011_GWD2_52_7 TaxID=1618989 RepID=A0A0G1XFX3_9BACT|nr:MAG: hypothetical protein UY72_C0021G0002 [Candidatus Uhrbacteria bacterium GW2011_GWD2_52_7]
MDKSLAMLLRIFLGLLVCGLGWLMVWKTQWFLDMLGFVSWAEEHLGSGGTRMFYKLMGTLIIVIGFIVITNLWDHIIGGLIRSIF